MAIVLDTSVVVAWFAPDEAPAPALIRRVSSEDFVVPPIWPDEVVNALLVLVRRGRLAPPQAAEIMNELEALHVLIEHPDYRRTAQWVYPLASRYDLSVYDASYLELARRRELPLVTLDIQLRSAAKKAKVKTL
jgi:predicted nucleic acid-binding protein